MEVLFVLFGRADYCAPREMWGSLPTCGLTWRKKMISNKDRLHLINFDNVLHVEGVTVIFWTDAIFNVLTEDMW